MTELGPGAYLSPGAGIVGKCIAACTVCALSSADQLAVQHVRPHQGMELEQGKPKDDSNSDRSKKADPAIHHSTGTGHHSQSCNQTVISFYSMPTSKT